MPRARHLQARGERLAMGIAAGMCNINDFGCNYLCQSLPFGGCKVTPPFMCSAWGHDVALLVTRLLNVSP